MPKKYTFVIGATLLIVVYCVWALVRPLPALQPTADFQLAPPINSKPAAITWATTGNQALGATTAGVIDTHGSQTAQPMASVAKVMLVLAILNKHPIKTGQSGAAVPITANDVAIYQQYASSDQSVVAVRAGVSLSEYQALQGLLLASGNNLATTLANWGFGSMQAYTNYANSYAKQLGMTKAHFADASGFSPSTVASPKDLVLLGIQAMKNPVIAKIVSQKTATLPIAGQIKNYNASLGGSAGINGIKTGNTIEAGGCFLFSSKFSNFTLVGVIMGAPNLATALHDSGPVMASFSRNVQIDNVTARDQIAGYYTVPWQGKINFVADQDVTVVDLAGHQIKPTVNVAPIKSSATNQQKVGTAKFNYGGKAYSSTLLLSQAIAKPSFVWRLLHPKF